MLLKLEVSRLKGPTEFLPASLLQGRKLHCWLGLAPVKPFVTDISVRSPRKLLIILIKKYKYVIKASKNIVRVVLRKASLLSALTTPLTAAPRQKRWDQLTRSKHASTLHVCLDKSDGLVAENSSDLSNPQVERNWKQKGYKKSGSV